MIRPCTEADLPRIFQVINDAATAYRGVIPDDCYHEPYMPLEELLAESREMTFFGWEESGELVGIMGYQPIGQPRRPSPSSATPTCCPTVSARAWAAPSSSTSWA